jgi:hypothetical protein
LVSTVSVQLFTHASNHIITHKIFMSPNILSCTIHPKQTIGLASRPIFTRNHFVYAWKNPLLCLPRKWIFYPSTAYEVQTLLLLRFSSYSMVPKRAPVCFQGGEGSAPFIQTEWPSICSPEQIQLSSMWLWRTII